MKRSTAITWDQLRVGALLLAGLIIVAVATLQLGQAARLFGGRYELVTFMPDVAGLRVGGGVTLAGQLAGTIRRIEFLPPSADTLRNLRVVIEVEEALQEQIREDSRVRLRTRGLLGDRVVDISPGTPRYPVLQAGDTLQRIETVDYDEVLTQAAGAVGDLVELTRDLRVITGSLVRGEGTAGRLLVDRTLYDQLAQSLAEVNRLMVRVQQPTGTFGRLLDDPALYDRLTSATAALDTVLRQMNSSQGTLGRLLHDDTLYTRMVGVTANADSVLRLMTQGDGLAARMLTDQQLYDRLNQTLTQLNTILEDVRRNPSRYTRGMVRVF
jgi:phospholipid/cholesterol/gamma-HCH transport system substrate-binding protein